MSWIDLVSLSLVNVRGPWLDRGQRMSGLMAAACCCSKAQTVFLAPCGGQTCGWPPGAVPGFPEAGLDSDPHGPAGPADVPSVAPHQGRARDSVAGWNQVAGHQSRGDAVSAGELGVEVRVAAGGPERAAEAGPAERSAVVAAGRSSGAVRH